MYANSLPPRAVRRGIVLVLVLGMLGLMALIGVTFAVFAGQSLINGRNFAQGVARPQAEALMDYALAQLINDTNNPASAIRGHSLLRDMYGNDSIYRGSNPPANASVETGGVMTQVYDGGLSTLHFRFARPHPLATATPFYNQYQYVTNIPTGGQYYGLDFTRWIVRFPALNSPMGVGNTVSQSFEILADDATGSDATYPGYHIFTLAGNLINPTQDFTYPNAPTPAPFTVTDWTSFIYANPNSNITNAASLASTPAPPYTFTKLYTSLSKELSTDIPANKAGKLTSVSNPFILEGRYMRAFNGPGLTRLANTAADVYPYNLAAYGNFRLNGLDPDAIGMDEDYDACDLENWYLGIQSADGQVVIPSFHRPGILAAADWDLTATPQQRAKILRPRRADHSPLFPQDPSTPDPIGGKLTFDVDNDGDGLTDSVWLDLGYPIQRDPGGKLFKPLFAFMVIGLNGRMPLEYRGEHPVTRHRG